MKAVIYARYSPGPRQTEQSIEGQLRVCTDFCKQRGLEVAEVYAYDDKLLIYFNISSEDGKLKVSDLAPLEAGMFDQRCVGSTNLIAGRTPAAAVIALPYGFVLAAHLEDRL